MPAEAPALLLRADASPAIGAGHVVRSLALARAYAGSRKTLLTVAPSDFVRAQAAEARVDVRELAPSADPAAVLEAVAAERSPWVVLDGYGFDKAYQSALRARGARLLVLDDDPRLPDYDADLLLDQNLGAESKAYRGVPKDRQLLGSRFALLRRGVTEPAPPVRRFDGPARRWLVTFGGSDPTGMIPRVVAALASCPTPEEIVVVAGPQNPRLAEIRAAAAADRRVRVEAAADVPALMRRADAGVISAGSSSWEAAHLGLPCLVFAAVGNQSPIAAALVAAGAAAPLDPAAIAAGIEALAKDAPRRAALSAAASRLVDGKGAERVCAAMLAPAGGRA